MCISHLIHCGHSSCSVKKCVYRLSVGDSATSDRHFLSALATLPARFAVTLSFCTAVIHQLDDGQQAHSKGMYQDQ